MKPVRDAFADALGALLALGMNPDAQVSLSVFSICSLFIVNVVIYHLVLGTTKGKGYYS